MPAPETTIEQAEETIQVGRQAIFDRDLQVFAYELLYRDADGGCTIDDGDQASSRTLLNAFMDLGLDRITGPHKAFINLTRRFFVEMPTLPFDHDRVVLEVLEDVEVDEALLGGLRRLAEQGFELAMDDYDFQPELAPVLPLVRFIKVEISSDNLDRLERRMPELRTTGAKLLAEKVETAEQFERLKGMGFDYFQGYFFARPKLVKADRVSENTAMVMQLLARLNDPRVPMDEVVQLVSQDPGLSFKVLRYVNSAAVGLRSKIESIRRAVVMMGLQRIRAWASLFAMAGMDGQPSEILNLGMLRANLCERLCRLCGDGDPDTAYTVGLLSVLDAIVSRPLNSLVDEMSLPAAVRQAIVEKTGGYGEILVGALQLERGDWPSLSCPNASREQVIEAFAESSELAFKTLALLGDA